MKVNFSIVVDETFRRRLRAALGRGGMATRKEIRIWIGGVVNRAGVDLPQPKVRRQRVAATVIEEVTPGGGRFRQHIDPNAVCGRCGQTRLEHGISGSCPVSKHVPPRSTFVASAEVRS